MANLNDVLQGLINVDTKIIQKMNNRFETFSLLDIKADNTGAGVVTEDIYASNGSSIQATSTADSAVLLFEGTFSPVKFGQYGLVIRAKTSNYTDSTLLATITINANNTVITKDINCNQFTSDTYEYIYITFNHERAYDLKPDENNTDVSLSISLSSATADATVCFDYAYITLLTPAVFI